MLVPELEEPIEYPTSDGRPLGETDTHRNQIIDLIHALDLRYSAQPETYVSGNLLLFYEEGNRRRHLSPDVMVVFGVPDQERDNYLLWEEGKAPDVVIEVTSRSTRTEDMGFKKGLYALLGVQEYYIFDPLREYLQPRLKAYRLQGEDYQPVIGDPLTSPRLGLELRIVDDRLRLYDPEAETLLPTRRDTEEARRSAEEALERERRERMALEAELRELRARLDNS